MAVIRRCVGVDLGFSSIKVAEVALEKNRVRIVNLASADTQITPDVPPSERDHIKLRTLRELLRANRITTKEAVFSLPGHIAFIRRLRLPHTTMDRLARIIQYEAREQIPFALDKIMLEFQVFSTDSEEEVEALIVAIKKENIAERMSLIRKTGLKPLRVTIGPFALYNFHAFAFSTLAELVPKKKSKGKLSLSAILKKKKGAVSRPEEAPGPEEETYEEVKAFVNIGATTLDLSIARLGAQQALSFSRSVPIAGNDITRAIQEKCSLESFEQAEQMKRQSTAIVLPGDEEETPSGYNKDASQAATSVVDRLIGELRRSLDFYISQPDGMAVDTIYLSGGLASLPNLPSYIQNRLGLPVEISKTIKNPNVSIDGNGSKDITPFLIALGLAVTGLGLGKINVDFLPPELKVLREFKKKNILVLMLFLMLIGMILISSSAGQRYVDEYDTRIKSYDSWLQLNTDLQKGIETAISKRKEVKDSFEKLATVLPDKRDYWLNFLYTIEQLKPPEILLVEVHLGARGNVKIVGETEEEISVAQFTKSLQANLVGKFVETPENVRFTNSYAVNSVQFNKVVNRFEIEIDCKDKISRIALGGIPFKGEKKPRPAEVAPAPRMEVPERAPTPAAPSRRGTIEEF
jgi:type IV pilus assembly protein PilM